MCQARKLRGKYRREVLFSVFSFCFAFRLCVDIGLKKNFHCGNVGSSCNKETMCIRGRLKINAGFRTLSEKRNSWVISPT